MKKATFAIGIPTLNRYDLLENSLEHYLYNDFTTTEVFVVDNGQQNIILKDKNLTLLTSSKNLGVAGSWNILLEMIYSKYTHALILNDDVFLGKKEDEISDLINTQIEDFYVTMHNWCSFVIPESTYNLVRGFDTDFYPAYFEDNDYHYRMKLHGLSYYKTEILNPQIFRNSMTIQKDPNINSTFEQNKEYYIQKWGGLPGEEKYLTPFNL